MDLPTLIIIIIVGMAIAVFLNRSRGNASTSANNQQQGNERPVHNDPNVQGQGSFGRDRTNQNSSNRETSSSRGSNEPSARNDDPNIEGRGSFGRDNKSQSSSDSYTSGSSRPSPSSPGTRSSDDESGQLSGEVLRNSLRDNEREESSYRRDSSGRSDDDASGQLSAESLRNSLKDDDSEEGDSRRDAPSRSSRRSSSNDDPDIEGHGSFGRDKD